MAWQRKGNSYQNYGAEQSSVVEDSFISEMMQDFGKFNQDFFITKMMSKAIDMLGTDPQRFVLLVDMLHMALMESNKLDEEYDTILNKRMAEFEKIEGKEPGDLERKLEWKLKKASIKYAVIFGNLSSKQPVEVVGIVDPEKYKAGRKAKKSTEQEDQEDVEVCDTEIKSPLEDSTTSL